MTGQKCTTSVGLRVTLGLTTGCWKPHSKHARAGSSFEIGDSSVVKEGKGCLSSYSDWHHTVLPHKSAATAYRANISSLCSCLFERNLGSHEVFVSPFFALQRYCSRENIWLKKKNWVTNSELFLQTSIKISAILYVFILDYAAWLIKWGFWLFKIALFKQLKQKHFH